MEMSNYIMQILKSQPAIVMCWGFHAPAAISNGLKFNVDGYLHKGEVTVTYDDVPDTFTVRTLKGGKTVKETSGVYLDNLVTVIDSMVETA